MATDAGTITASIELELGKLSGQINSVNTKLDKFSERSNKRANKFSKSWEERFGKFNVAGVAAFAGVTAALKGSISTFATFEQSLANVASVAGASASELKLLEDTALSMGQTTRFTASEAADALYNLASAGLDAAESAAALEGVLNLAGATGSDLAFTSATMTATMSQFGIEAENSADVANIFAAAIAGSQANMDKLASAFRQVGPVASGFGISLEETTGALEVLFNAGFRGESAGVALRNILSKIANESGPTASKLKKLGVNIKQLSAAETVADKIDILSKANLDAKGAVAAFGESGTALIPLLSAGKAGIEEYTASVTDTTKAAELYAIQNDTLQGSLDSAGSAVESMAISLGDSLEPVIRPMVDLFASFIRTIAGAPKWIIAFVTSFGLITTGIFAASSAVTLFGSVLTISLGPAGLIIAGITAGVVALTSAFGNASGSAEELANVTKELSKTSKEYAEITEKLENDATLGAKQRIRLERDQKELLEKRKADALGLADIYNDQLKTIKETSSAFKENEKEQDRLNDKLRDLEKSGISFKKVMEGIAAFPATPKLSAKFDLSRAEKEGKKLNKTIIDTDADAEKLVETFAGLLKEGVVTFDDITTSNLKLFEAATKLTDNYYDMNKQVEDLNENKDKLADSTVAVTFSKEGEVIQQNIEKLTEYRRKLLDQRDDAKKRKADLLEEQGDIEQAFKLRQDLLNKEENTENALLELRKRRLKEEIDALSTSDNATEEQIALRKQLTEQLLSEGLSIREFYNNEEVRLNQEKLDAIAEQERNQARLIAGVGKQLFSELQTIVW
jgi:TP901 family phage tail tape measure protein